MNLEEARQVMRQDGATIIALRQRAEKAEAEVHMLQDCRMELECACDKLKSEAERLRDLIRNWVICLENHGQRELAEYLEDDLHGRESEPERWKAQQKELE